MCGARCGVRGRAADARLAELDFGKLLNKVNEAYATAGSVPVHFGRREKLLEMRKKRTMEKKRFVWPLCGQGRAPADSAALQAVPLAPAAVHPGGARQQAGAAGATARARGVREKDASGKAQQEAPGGRQGA